MGFTAAILGIFAGLAGLMVWTALLFATPVAKARELLETRPWRCLGTGVLLALLLVTPSIVLLQAKHGGAKVGGWALLLATASMLAVGLTGMASLLGERLRAMSPGITPLGSLVRGAITIEFAMLVPFFGWFLFTPLVAVTVLGAGALGVASLRRASRSAHNIPLSPAVPSSPLLTQQTVVGE
jgi:hypothetical protein